MIVLLLALACEAPSTATKSDKWFVASGFCGFGMSVGAAGDYDRDGTPDWIVADHGCSQDSIVPRIWILSGKSASVLRSIELPNVDGGNIRIEGGHDVDADGVPDLLVAVATTAGAKGDDGVHLVSGSSGRVLRTLPAHTAWQDRGAWARFVHDVDGDGARDVAVLSRDEDSSHRILVVHSGRTGAALSTTSIEGACGDGPCGVLDLGSGSADVRRYAVLLDGIGTRPSFVQIVDEKKSKALWPLTDCKEPAPDSYGQLVELRIGTSPTILAVAHGDAVDLLDGATGARLHRLTPVGKTDSEMGYGWDLAPLGDIDGDGTGDLAFSETESGLSRGIVRAISGKTAKELWATSSDAEDIYRLGYALASLGDIDGDGVADLAAGTWGSKAGVPGRAFLLSGKKGTIVREVRRSGDGVVAVPKREPVTGPR